MLSVIIVASIALAVFLATKQATIQDFSVSSSPI